jgi:hypothetical protein
VCTEMEKFCSRSVRVQNNLRMHFRLRCFFKACFSSSHCQLLWGEVLLFVGMEEGQKTLTRKKTRRSQKICLEEEARVAFEVVEELLLAQLDDCSFVAAYVLMYACVRSPGGVICGKRAVAITNEHFEDVSLLDLPLLCRLLGGEKYVVGKKKLATMGLWQLYNHSHLCKLSNFVSESLVAWRLGRRPFVLLRHIPLPLEVLEQQACGKRVVTAFVTKKELELKHKNLLSYMENGDLMHSRDSFEFVVHDLHHMEHFAGRDSFLEQVGFFSAMSSLQPDTKGFFDESFPGGEKEIT